MFVSDFGANTVSEFVLLVNGASTPIATIMGVARRSGAAQLRPPTMRTKH